MKKLIFTLGLMLLASCGQLGQDNKKHKDQNPEFFDQYNKTYPEFLNFNPIKAFAAFDIDQMCQGLDQFFIELDASNKTSFSYNIAQSCEVSGEDWWMYLNTKIEVIEDGDVLEVMDIRIIEAFINSTRSLKVQLEKSDERYLLSGDESFQTRKSNYIYSKVDPRLEQITASLYAYLFANKPGNYTIFGMGYQEFKEDVFARAKESGIQFFGKDKMVKFETINGLPVADTGELKIINTDALPILGCEDQICLNNTTFTYWFAGNRLQIDGIMEETENSYKRYRSYFVVFEANDANVSGE